MNILCAIHINSYMPINSCNIVRKKIALKLKSNTPNLVPAPSPLSPPALRLSPSPANVPPKPNNMIIRRKIQLKLKPTDNQTQTKISTDKIPIQVKSDITTYDQLIEYLDQKYLHHLMYLKDSWSEVKYKIKMNTYSTSNTTTDTGQECWWDLEILLKHFAEQLNTACMDGPSPQYPSNPFNRQPFRRSQLLTLHEQIKELHLPVNYLIAELFDYLKQSKSDLPNLTTFAKNFIAFISPKYRFRLVNHKDSQENYIGYWVKKTDPLTLFELRYNELKLITPSEYDARHDRLVERRQYRLYREILNLFPKENIDLDQVALDFRYV
jgi:hypothetical protein